RHRELEQVQRPGADDVTEGGVRPLVEGKEETHGRRLVVQALHAGQGGLGPEAGPGDHHVERTAAGDDLVHNGQAVTGDHLGAGPEVSGHPPDLVGQVRFFFDYEDLRVAHGYPYRAFRASATLEPGVSPTAGASLLTREK